MLGARAPGDPDCMSRVLEWVFLAFVASLAPGKSVLAGDVGSVVRAFGLLVALIFIADLLLRRGILRGSKDRFVITAAAFAAWVTASMLWTAHTGATVSASLTQWQLVAMVVIFAHYVDGPTRWERIGVAYVAGAGIMVVIGIASAIRSTAVRDVGVMNPNELAILAALAVPVSCVVARRAGSATVRWGARCYPVLAIAAIVATGSRGGLLTLAVSMLALPFSIVSDRRRIRVLVGLGVFGAAAIMLRERIPERVPFWDWGVQRLLTVRESVAEGELGGRTEIWRVGLEVAASHPWVGVGAGGFRYAVSPPFLSPVAAHNGFLSVAVGVGAIGLTIFGLLWALAAFRAVRFRRVAPEVVVLLGALVAAMWTMNAETDGALWLLLTWTAFVGRGFRGDPSPSVLRGAVDHGRSFP
jgi:O-antigen ligase